MNPDKIASMLKARKKKFGPRHSHSREEEWAKYLKTHRISKTGIVELTSMLNGGQLQGKYVVQTDFLNGQPATNHKDLEDAELHASDIVFYVMDRETAEKILVLGLP